MPDKTYAKVVLNGTTYVDLTSDTVDPSTLLAGYTAHDRSGALITGSFDTSIFVLKAGDTMTGPLILSGAPTENLHAATKKYVDDTAANYVTLTTDQNITGTKTFVGQKKILFKQSSTSDKLGFTLYKSDSTEQGYLEYNPSNKVDNAPLFTLGNYATTTSGICQVGFRRYSGVSGANGAYNLLTPLIADAKTPFSLTTTYTNFYLPLGFKVNASNTLTTAKSGVVDLSYYFTYAREGVKQTSTISSSDTELRVLLSNQGTNSDEVAQVKKCNYFTFDARNSILTIFRRGNADTTVKAGLILGNDVAGGTYGNSYGDIVMYGQGTYYYNITGNNPSEALTENRTLTLPNKSGTIAITDDLNSYLPLTGGVIGKSVDDPEDENHGYIYTNTIQPDYITLNKDEYYSHALVGNTYSGITPGNITLSKLYTDTSTDYVVTSILNDSELSFETGPYGGSRTKYASYKSNGISYTTYNYVFPSKSGTFALTNDLLSYIPKTGGTITGGYLIIEDTHLTSGSASAYLTLGNNVDSSSEGSSVGVLHLYGTGVYKSSIRTTTLTDNRQLYLPDKDGTLAVTSDLDSYVLKTGDSLTGALSFYDGSTLKSKISNTELQINGHNLLKTTRHLSQAFSTLISANANLNSSTYTAIGTYFAYDSTAIASLTNCPTTEPFTMYVEAPINSSETNTGTFIYRVRHIITYSGNEYVQRCYVTNVANAWGFGNWQPYIIGYTAGNLQVNTSGASLDESYCKQYGKTVNVRAWITGLSTSTQTHTNVITVQLVDMPTTAVRFVFTCWLGNGIAAYAGYGVMDTSGRITLVKAVANSDKASFEFTYNV